MTVDKTVRIDGRQVPVEGERNLLELARKANIEIPTFCYHSELSVYGACRLCLVEVEGRGLVASCSVTPEPGMVVRTHTDEIREIRRIAVELLLANHHQGCTTCGKSDTCKLLGLARRLGIESVRFPTAHEPAPLDDTNPALVRDPNKCILCGDCVRMCNEVQGIGAIDFAHRGAQVTVTPAYGNRLEDVECVFCGQCARVCPTGAIVPRSEIAPVWMAVNDPERRVVGQIAPAVRVAVGEAFGLEPGTDVTGRIVAALKRIGFDAVFDTSFAADLTVVEEANEFLRRKETGETLPQFTSCCPAWVAFAEQYVPELLPNLSSCRSPQQMFGAVAKRMLPEALNVKPEQLTVVSIMPCTAKKAEARRPEFAKDGPADVDLVLTTRELVRMIEESGQDFLRLNPEALDLPLGFKTGAGVIFGSSGGVSEAVLRYAHGKVNGRNGARPEFREVRGEDGVRTVDVTLGDETLRLAVVHGLGNARAVAEAVQNGEADYDLIEVMACPGGCIGGAGQPVCVDAAVRRDRAKGLYEADRRLQLHTADDNPYVHACYRDWLGEVGGPEAHALLHTEYGPRQRIRGEAVALAAAGEEEPLPVTVCLGTSCYLRGARDLLDRIGDAIDAAGWTGTVDLKATFCHEKCDRGPVVRVNGRVLTRCTVTEALQAVQEELERPRAETAVSS